MKAAKVSRTVPQGIAVGSAVSARQGLCERLQGRRPEIEEAILTRVYGVSDPTEAGDPTYMEGLRAAVAAAIDYGLDSIASSERNPPQLPPELLVQARIAARHKVSLDTVLRRYFAGYALLGDFLIEEADGAELRGDSLQHLLRIQASTFDRLLAAVSEEHAREADDRLTTSDERRAELAQRLLAGERIDAAELSYELEANHLGAIAKGPGAADALRELARLLDRRLLLLGQRESVVWAWLGGRQAIEIADLERVVPRALPSEVSLVIGEPGEGLGGWRLTHRQAKAALPIGLRSSEPFVRYADVALLASILQDDLLRTSLREIYLAPLEGERDGGKMALETLRAYFAAGRNVSSAAVVLGVSRQAVAKRLASIEERLRGISSTSWLEVEAAIRIEALSH
jgi:diguanylate cyclase with GGDEF domain/PucR-like helix-turn-helix protein